MDSPVEQFTPDEQRRLRAHVTNLDRPVFALVNLPETVKGALFARYSRYQGTLRRLFLDEFAASLPGGAPAWEAEEGERAAALYERIFVGYGDDSVAQLGGAHVACEWTSNIVTKLLQRPRLGAYLEQSTRYIAYDGQVDFATAGRGYRYHREPVFGPAYEAAMDGLFTTYAELLPRVRGWVEASFPGDASPARDRAVQAKALDLLRGLLPAASLSHMGIYATGQTYEQLILHLLAHPLPEARAYGEGILEAVRAVMPSFVSRVPRPERGGEWIAYLGERDAAASRWVARLGLDRPAAATAEVRPSVRLLHVDGDEDALLAALLFESAGVAEEDARIRLAALTADERAALLVDLLGGRGNRRHRPGRGLEVLRYRFEIVADYGAFRDLQRHRMLTVQWQALTPDHRGRRARGGRGGGLRGGVRARAGRVARGVRAPRRRRPRRARGGLRAVPGLPDPLRPGPQRAGRHAARRAALGPRGAPVLPRRGPRDAPPDRPGAPRRRRRDDARRHGGRAAPGADPLRDAHPGPPGRADRRLRRGPARAGGGSAGPDSSRRRGTGGF